MWKFPTTRNLLQDGGAQQGPSPCTHLLQRSTPHILQVSETMGGVARVCGLDTRNVFHYGYAEAHTGFDVSSPRLIDI